MDWRHVKKDHEREGEEVLVERWRRIWLAMEVVKLMEILGFERLIQFPFTMFAHTQLIKSISFFLIFNF